MFIDGVLKHHATPSLGCILVFQRLANLAGYKSNVYLSSGGLFIDLNR